MICSRNFLLLLINFAAAQYNPELGKTLQYIFSNFTAVYGFCGRNLAVKMYFSNEEFIKNSDKIVKPLPSPEISVQNDHEIFNFSFLPFKNLILFMHSFLKL